MGQRGRLTALQQHRLAPTHSCVVHPHPHTQPQLLQCNLHCLQLVGNNCNTARQQQLEDSQAASHLQRDALTASSKGTPALGRRNLCQVYTGWVHPATRRHPPSHPPRHTHMGPMCVRRALTVVLMVHVMCTVPEHGHNEKDTTTTHFTCIECIECSVDADKDRHCCQTHAWSLIHHTPGWQHTAAWAFDPSTPADIIMHRGQCG